MQLYVRQYYDTYMAFIKRPKIGLALGSGGPKGLVHIGILKILEKYNIPIDFIAGTSAGSLIGACYAFTKDIKPIEEFFVEANWVQMVKLLADPALNDGMLRGQKVKEFLEKFFGGDLTFEKLKIPFCAVSTDLKTGETITLCGGHLIEAIRASCAIPVVFSPIKYHDYILVDGALTSAVPVNAVKQMGADIVIAVNLEQNIFDNSVNEKMNLLQVGKRTFNVIAHRVGLDEVSNADLVLNPKAQNLTWTSLLSIKDKRAGVVLGEQLMEKNMINLQKILSHKRPVLHKIQDFFRNLISLENGSSSELIQKPAYNRQDNTE